MGARTDPPKPMPARVMLIANPRILLNQAVIIMDTGMKQAPAQKNPSITAEI